MTSPEAAPRTPSGQELQALLRKVPTHSGAEYRNWIALLKKAEAEAAQPATPVGALDGIMLNAIRYRAAQGYGQSVVDRAWLLRYIDRLTSTDKADQ